MNLDLASARLLSGNEAVALAARDAGVALGTGYPGTPRPKFSNTFTPSAAGRSGRRTKRWLGSGLGRGLRLGRRAGDDEARRAERGGRSALHRRLHRRAPGRWWSSRPTIRAWLPARTSKTTAATPWRPACRCSNRPIRRRPTTSRWPPSTFPPAGTCPCMLRMTTRVCHSKTLVRAASADAIRRRRRISSATSRGRVMIPLHARPAHRRLRQKLAEIAAWNETCPLNRVVEGDRRRGHHHVRRGVHARPRGRARGRGAEARRDAIRCRSSRSAGSPRASSGAW